MKTRSSILVSALCFTLVLSASALPQNYNRARQAAEAARDSANGNVPSAILPTPQFTISSTANTPSAAMLESVIPREGMQFYFEVRSGGFAQLMQSASSLAPLVKMFAGQTKVSSEDFTAFALAQMGALSKARVAVAGYGGSNAAALFEAASPADAEGLRSSLARMLASSGAEMDVQLIGQVVVAGPKATVARLARWGDAIPLAEDRMFMRMRERFAADPFFAYAELGSQIPMMPEGESSAYMAGLLTGLASRPYAIACGGSLQGDTARVRALALFMSKKGEGVFLDIFSSDSSTEAGLVGASYAAPDVDLFLDLKLNWGKLYDALQSVFSMAASAMMQAGNQSSNAAPGTDLFSMAEAQLGFSIKNDLLPTLGDEVAISFADFSKFVKPAQQPAVDAATGRPQVRLPRILVMVELRDQARFEQLLNRLLNPPNREPVQLTQEAYRGATIKYGSSMAFAISRGFFLFAPSAAEIRRALDARALGRSLASSAEFRSAVGSSDRPAMQAYVSPAMAGMMMKSVVDEAAKSNEALKGFAPAAVRTRSAIGLTMKSESEGLLMDMRVPANLAFMALASMATAKPVPYGITTSGQRRNNSRKTPKMTDEDVKVVRRR